MGRAARSHSEQRYRHDCNVRTPALTASSGHGGLSAFAHAKRLDCVNVRGLQSGAGQHLEARLRVRHMALCRKPANVSTFR